MVSTGLSTEVTAPDSRGQHYTVPTVHYTRGRKLGVKGEFDPFLLENVQI